MVDDEARRKRSEALDELSRVTEEAYENHWREKIAKDLESYKSANEHPRWITVEQAAAIARGQR